MNKEEHPEAKYIVDTLAEQGYTAYYAGGWVRDYLLNTPSDDIDIATNASPEIIQKLFPKTVPIGLSFGIILVLVGEKQFEVASFRSDFDYQDGRRPTKVVFCSAEEDAKRRDFTINGMFYDPIKEEILDFVGGKEDLKKKLIRAIGDPHARIQEDKLRMIRGIRLSCRLQFTIDSQTSDAIKAHAEQLFPAVAVERVWQEFCKMALFPGFRRALLMLHEYGLLQAIFPDLREVSTKKMNDLSHPLEDFPKDTPVIAYLLEFFPEYSKKERENLCKKLKLSKQETQFAEFLFEADKLQRKKEAENIEWAHFYAHSFSTKCIQIFAARLSMHERHEFLQKHEERRRSLENSIRRIVEKKPLITAERLQRLGISPSPQMGKLLLEAEKISANLNLHEEEAVIRHLKKSALWPLS